MARTKPADTTVTSLQLGDKVWWRGIELTVTEFFEGGDVEAMSQTMRVRLSNPSDFVKVVG